jgi:hypothetical protein
LNAALLARAAFWVITLCLPAALIAQPVAPIGLELQISTYTALTQGRPSVAMGLSGLYVVVWQANDGSGTGISGRRVSDMNVPQPQFQVNTFTSGSQNYAAVATDGDGDFIVAWESDLQDGEASGIVARRYDFNGGSLGGEFQVNALTTLSQERPSLAVSAAGDFLVGWFAYPQGGGLARRFDSAGAPQDLEFHVDGSDSTIEYATAAGFDDEGDFVVAWDTYDGDIGARRFDSAGNSQGASFLVATHTAEPQINPAVAVAADGDFVVVWQGGFGGYGDGSGFGIFARLFASSGSSVGAAFQVNTYTTGSQTLPSVAGEDDGDFVVVWSSIQENGESGVFGRSFTSAGTGQGLEFQVNVLTQLHSSFPRLATDRNGRFVVVWQTSLDDLGSSVILARRLAPVLAPVLDVDGNGALQALADGLLVLRYRFGLTGTALTGGAVGANCTRCDAAAIEPYLGGLGTMLDIDGNGSLQALSDGLLVLRYLFNLTGNTLTTGVIGANCTRCDAGEIEPYLQTLD